ncbi:MAG: glycosyltransferase family 2 protein [Deltaproteobacteria bacterium]|nr:MAG: glycosyltransferase family 2 protein [Deltaproteobacteria bacterium]
MKELPFVSVVIPMRNERDWIERSLGAVLAQDYPPDRMEVLVADGMSDDGSREILKKIASEDGRVRVVDNPGRIVPTGLNAAIRQARGDVVARVDAHTILESDYLRRGVEVLERTGAEGVGGPMVSMGGGPVGDAIARAMKSRFGIGAAFHFAEKECEADTVYMGMWPRRLFDRIGVFDEELVRDQDDEFSYRIRKHGGRLILAPQMKSRYQNRQSWAALARQFYQYGFWKVRVLQKHPRQMSVRHFIPPLFDAGIAAGALLSPLAGWCGAAAAAAACVYALTMLAVAAVEGDGALSQRLRLAVALAIIHHAWATGFLVGLVRFAARWWDEPASGEARAGARREHVEGEAFHE